MISKTPRIATSVKVIMLPPACAAYWAPACPLDCRQRLLRSLQISSVVDRHRRAVGGKPRGNLSTDATARAGDECDFPFEVGHLTKLPENWFRHATVGHRTNIRAQCYGDGTAGPPLQQVAR